MNHICIWFLNYKLFWVSEFFVPGFCPLPVDEPHTLVLVSRLLSRLFLTGTGHWLGLVTAGTSSREEISQSSSSSSSSVYWKQQGTTTTHYKSSIEIKLISVVRNAKFKCSSSLLTYLYGFYIKDGVLEV